MPPIRLLYAEDDPDTRELIVLALQLKGFEVVCPPNLKDFLRLAKDEAWHLYMLDTWMPEISGLELCRRIRELDPQTPIVFYSGAAFERDRKKALECGASDYIVKPIEFDLLAERLKAAVDSAPIP